MSNRYLSITKKQLKHIFVDLKSWKKS